MQTYLSELTPLMSRAMAAALKVIESSESKAAVPRKPNQLPPHFFLLNTLLTVLDFEKQKNVDFVLDLYNRCDQISLATADKTFVKNIRRHISQDKTLRPLDIAFVKVGK